jgi:beta-mannosidase
MRFAKSCMGMSFGLILFALSLLFAANAEAAEPSARELNSGWQFRVVHKAEYVPPATGQGQTGQGQWKENSDSGELGQWHAAQVPGVVQTDLLANHLIPEPFERDNETRLQWVGESDWEYQTTFAMDSKGLTREHVDLVFDGLDTFADVYLNEHLIAQTDNMFRRYRFPVKQFLQAGSNTLRVVFHSPITKMLPYVKSLPYVLPAISASLGGNEENIATSAYTRKAPYNYGWDWGPRFVTEGMWRPVQLESWDALRIENFHIHQESVGKDLAKLTAEVEIEASAPASVTIGLNHNELSGKSVDDGKTTAQIDAGTNHISVPLRIAAPKLWYPVGYGAQDRYHFAAAVRQPRAAVPTKGDAVLAHADVTTGLRTVELRRVTDQFGKSFEFVVNGIEVYAKGANVIPFDSFPARVTRATYRQILESARDAHMNMLREWGGGIYESDDFYDICDELGLLVWQEFTFGGDNVPGDVAYQENVREEAIQQVKRLREHPSIAVWCGNNEVETGWLHWGDRQAFRDAVPRPVSERVWQDYMVMFADILKSVVRDYGDGVPYKPSSPSANFEEPPDNDHNGDVHSWVVWHQQAPPSEYLRTQPRFVSEYGFQSFPEMRTIRSFAQPEDLDIRSAVMQSHQKNKGGNERILTYMLREYREPKDFASFVYLSQVQQAEVIKIGAEHFRRSKPRTMGTLYWQLNDCWPVASWASIDYYGRWKALQFYTRRFYDDVLVSPYEHDGKVEVYVISDKLQALSGKIHARLMDFSGNVLWEKTQEVQIPAAASAIYSTFEEKKLFADSSKTDRRRNFLIFDLEVAGKNVSRNSVFFDVTHNLELPVSPKIESRLTKTADGYALTLKSAALARDVQISFGDLDAQVSDNYFDLLPGEEVTVTVKAGAAAEQVQGALKVISLTDAFASQGTKY